MTALEVRMKFPEQVGLSLPEFSRIERLDPANVDFRLAVRQVFAGIKAGVFPEWDLLKNHWGVLVDEDRKRGVKYESFGVNQTGIAAWYFDFPEEVVLSQARLIEAIAFGKDKDAHQRLAVAKRSRVNQELIWFFYRETEPGNPLLVLSECGSGKMGWWKIGLDKNSDFKIGFDDLEMPAQTGYGSGTTYLDQHRIPDVERLGELLEPIKL